MWSSKKEKIAINLNLCHSIEMNNFKDAGFKKRGGDVGGRPKFGGSGRGGGFGGSRGNNRPQGQSEVFTTTCSACRKSCDVPFRPNGEKPVYCRECFGKKNQDTPSLDRGSKGAFTRYDDNRREKSTYAPQVREVQSTHDYGNQRELNEIKRQLETIESRLNTILNIINPPVPPQKKVARVEEVTPVETPKKERKPKVTKEVTPIAKKVVKKVVAKKVAKRVSKK